MCIMILYSKCTGPFSGRIAIIGVLLYYFVPRKNIHLICCVPLVLIYRMNINRYVGSSRFSYILSLCLDVTHYNSRTVWFFLLFLLLVLYVPPPVSSVPITLLDQWLHNNTGTLQQSSGVLFDCFHPILQFFFSFSILFVFYKFYGLRGMINIVVVLFSRVEVTGVLRIYILERISRPCLFHSPTEVIC